MEAIAHELAIASQQCNVSNIEKAETSNKSLKVNNSNNKTVIDYLNKTENTVKYRLQYCLAEIGKFFAYIFLLPKDTRNNLDERCKEYLKKIYNIQLKNLVLRAIRDENLIKLEQILKKNPDIPEIKGLFYESVKYQNTDIVLSLLQKGIETDSIDNECIDIALKLAKNYDNQEIIELLEVYGKSKNDILSIAVKNNKILAIKYLLKSKSVDANGELLLFRLVRNAQTNLLKEILKFIPDLTITNNNGESLLNVAYACNQKEIFIDIYKAILHTNNSKNPVKHFNEYSEDLNIDDLIKLLLNGLDITDITDTNYFALINTVLSGSDDDSKKKFTLMHDWLGISFTELNNDGFSFLDIAAASGETVKVQRFVSYVSSVEYHLLYKALILAFKKENNIETCLTLLPSYIIMVHYLKNFFSITNESQEQFESSEKDKSYQAVVKQHLKVLSHPNYGLSLEKTISDFMSSSKNFTALLIYYAIKYGAIDILKAFKNNGANFNKRNFYAGHKTFIEYGLNHTNPEVKEFFKSF